MNQAIDWINSIIQDLVDPSKKLKDTLLKVQVLAFQMKNSKLKDWVDGELNGYTGKDIPKYRNISCVVYGNIIQDRGFGGMLTKNNQPLPVEYLNVKFDRALKSVVMDASVSELELMVEKGGMYRIDIPHAIHKEITKLFENNWFVDTAWKSISLTSIEGIINSIKSNLLTFLLEVAEEIGENENINIMEHKKKIDSLFDQTIGNIIGENVNITIGNENLQSVNYGDSAKINIAKGSDIIQNINAEVVEELGKFINGLKNGLDKISLSLEDKSDLLTEISRIETQMQRQKPKYTIVGGALNAINGIIIGVAGNALTQPILEKLGWLIGQFNGQ